MNVRSSLALLFTLTGCVGGEAEDTGGFETSACIEDECFDGLECLSDLCIAPDGDSEPGTNPTGANPTSASVTNGNPTTASGTNDRDPSEGSGPSTASASASASASESSSASASDSSGESASASDSDSTGTTGGGETTDDISTTTGLSGPECGDGSIDPGEQCDSNNLGGFDCASLGLGNGSLNCDPVTCTYDTSMCGSTSGGTSG